MSLMSESPAPSYTDALRLNLRTYLADKPCKKKHMPYLRSTSGRNCVQCQLERNKDRAATERVDRRMRNGADRSQLTALAHVLPDVMIPAHLAPQVRRLLTRLVEHAQVARNDSTTYDYDLLIAPLGQMEQAHAAVFSTVGVPPVASRAYAGVLPAGTVPRAKPVMQRNPLFAAIPPHDQPRPPKVHYIGPLVEWDAPEALPGLGSLPPGAYALPPDEIREHLLWSVNTQQWCDRKAAEEPGRVVNQIDPDVGTVTLPCPTRMAEVQATYQIRLDTICQGWTHEAIVDLLATQRCGEGLSRYTLDEMTEPCRALPR